MSYQDQQPMVSADLKKRSDQIKAKRSKIETALGKISTLKRKIQTSKDYKKAEILKQKLKEGL